jgi:hypothetical protein
MKWLLKKCFPALFTRAVAAALPVDHVNAFAVTLPHLVEQRYRIVSVDEAHRLAASSASSAPQIAE